MFLCLVLPRYSSFLPQRHAFKLIVDGMVCVFGAYFHVDLVMSRRLVLGVPILPEGCCDSLELRDGVVSEPPFAKQLPATRGC